MEHFDHCIIGAGVVGLAVAFKLSQQQPKAKILLIESHRQFGRETSSRNSEVIHAGIYYPEKSLKAELCLKGRDQLYQFCQDHGVPHQRTGKLIIASTESDIEQLELIQKNAFKNGVRLDLIDQTYCAKIEPQVAAKAALVSLDTGIIDSHRYMQTLLGLAENQGVLYSPKTHFIKAEESPKGFKVRVDTDDGTFTFSCQYLINSAGLHAPNVAHTIYCHNTSAIPQYHFCRGQYYNYQGKAPFSHLIYPLPNKHSTGLGIHATLDLSGQVRFGPDVEFINNIDYSSDESHKQHFIQAIRPYFPKLDAHKLVLSYCGIRPKLTGPNEPAADFIIQTQKEHQTPGLINLYGIESPGLTASLAIADAINEHIFYP